MVWCCKLSFSAKKIYFICTVNSAQREHIVLFNSLNYYAACVAISIYLSLHTMVNICACARYELLTIQHRKLLN